MDTTLLVTTFLLTLLFIGLSTYFLLFRPKSTGPVIYILGPTGAGKTALWSYLKYGRVIPTQTSLSINAAPLTHASLEKQITVIDCPGHPRLAHLLRQSLAQTSPRGVILLIDAASLNKDLNSVANMVYSTLLALPRPIHVLLVANKSDLFTALPVNKVRELLEGEISSLKKTRDVGMDDDEERMTLGGAAFKFDELEDEGVMIEWTRGSIEARQVAGVLEWISKRVA